MYKSSSAGHLAGDAMPAETGAVGGEGSPPNDSGPTDSRRMAGIEVRSGAYSIMFANFAAL